MTTDITEWTIASCNITLLHSGTETSRVVSGRDHSVREALPRELHDRLPRPEFSWTEMSVFSWTRQLCCLPLICMSSIIIRTTSPTVQNTDANASANMKQNSQHKQSTNTTTRTKNCTMEYKCLNATCFASNHAKLSIQPRLQFSVLTPSVQQ